MQYNSASILKLDLSVLTEYIKPVQTLCFHANIVGMHL